MYLLDYVPALSSIKSYEKTQVLSWTVKILEKVGSWDSDTFR